VPKVESAGDLAFVERLLAGVELASRTPPLRVQALIETARGLAAIHEIAAASERLDALVLGYADLAASLGCDAALQADPRAWDAARHTLLVAARANGLQAIDGPYLGVKPDVAFAAAAVRARELGFDGKWAIHPAQVDPLNALFTPGEDEIGWARAVMEALDAAERDGGRGAVALDGQMLDEAIRMTARRVLARAAAAS
jgi:citrate lyase subunit beta/citryl-CoA lyase